MRASFLIVALAALLTLAFSVRAQVLFVSEYYSGNIYKFSPDIYGSRTTFASGLSGPSVLAFDNSGSLYVLNQAYLPWVTGQIYKFAPDGRLIDYISINNPSSLRGLAIAPSIPEPASLALIVALSGSGVLIALWRRRR